MELGFEDPFLRVLVHDKCVRSVRRLDELPAVALKVA